TARSSAGRLSYRALAVPVTSSTSSLGSTNTPPRPVYEEPTPAITGGGSSAHHSIEGIPFCFKHLRHPKGGQRILLQRRILLHQRLRRLPGLLEQRHVTGKIRY